MDSEQKIFFVNQQKRNLHEQHFLGNQVKSMVSKGFFIQVTPK